MKPKPLSLDEQRYYTGLKALPGDKVSYSNGIGTRRGIVFKVERTWLIGGVEHTRYFIHEIGDEKFELICKSDYDITLVSE